ncbi:type IV pilus assembly protein PilM [Fimbriiglobus ruber]|uniref:Putative fimbrial assembly protein PilM n=1 Tax=Fimbriiglobus ruber TaxID=1908690 RepID=A0A225DJ57_9BACT|nr:type IV pilus assembly protein PilM [Fimbriiglobus ruber]OWK36157.1 putative fimbrial assembly protein PilM [Fimbriiglobus ruber]
MAKPFGVWGIDIGQCALKALRLEMIDGQPTATAFDYIEHPKILSQPDADPDALTREALEKFLSRNPIGKDQVAIGIAGQSGLVRFVKLPPVEEKKVADIVKFEAKQQIPFPLEEVVWDFQKIAGGEAVGGFAMETEIGLFAMKRDIINKNLGFYQTAGSEVHLVQMAPLALCNYATYEILKKSEPGAAGAPAAEGAEPEAAVEDDTPRGKKRCAVVLDVGTDSANLIITDGGKIIWQRPIPLGGNHFTRALTKEMKLTFAKAEHLKRNAAKSPDLAQILRALRPVLTEFVGEVQRSLGYFTNTHRDAHVAYLVGLGSAFRLPGLQKYLSEKLSLDVRKPTKVERLAGDQVLNDPTFTENLLTFPVAYGLALQGLGMARLKTNLLPQEVRVERLIRAKKPFVAAAAAALLVGTGFLAVGYGAQLSAVTDPKIQTAIDSAKGSVTRATSQASEWTAKEAEVKKTTDEVKAIIVGNDERLNWVRFQEVLMLALPRHGNEQMGGNLTEVTKSDKLDVNQPDFWNNVNGNRAFEKYKDRLKSGLPLEKMFDDDLAQYLATVNLEAVYERYTDNVAAFLTAADDQVKMRLSYNIADDMLESEREMDEANKRYKPKPPSDAPAAPGGAPAAPSPAGASTGGGAWVIELRGYTYNEGGTNFLKQCLLRNLQKFDKFAEINKGDQKVAKVIPGGVDPIKGRVSHAFLLFSLVDDQPTPGQFKWINRNYADWLIAKSSAGGADPSGGMSKGLPGGMGGGPPPGGMGGMSPPPGGGGMAVPGGPGGPGGAGGPVGTSWSPLTGSTQFAGGGMGGPGGIGPMAPPGGMGGLGGGLGATGGDTAEPTWGSQATGSGPGMMGGPGMMPPRGEMPGGPGGPGVPGTAGTPGANAKKKPRYEFTVYLIWREPTPTDPTPTAGGS